MWVVGIETQLSFTQTKLSLKILGMQCGGGQMIEGKHLKLCVQLSR